MINTDKKNLPGVIIRAVWAHWYSGTKEERFASATQLPKPTKMVLS